MHRRCSTLSALAVAWFTLACSAPGAQPAVKSDVPVALPPFIVEEPTKGPPWRYTQAMGYEVLSRCNDATTRRVIEAHDRLHQLLAEVLPVELQVKFTVPRTLILYDEELQPAASKEVIARMLQKPVSVGLEPGDAGLSPGGRGGLRPVSPAPSFSFLPNLRLWDRDAMTVFMIVRRDDFDDSRLALTFDYVTYRLKSRVPSLAPWFLSGFLTFFRQTTFERRELLTEPMEWISPLHTAALKTDSKTAPPLQPLRDFFAVALAPRDPAAAFTPIQHWQAQAELFVRWGVDPKGGERKAAFWRFVEQTSRREASEALFQECFGFDFATAEAQLAVFMSDAVRSTVRFRPSLKKLPPLVLRNATDTELGRIKGDWERLEIGYVKQHAPELADKYIEQARRTLRRAYERGARDSPFLAVLGLCEVDAGSDATAREYLETAAALGPMRPRAWYELARLRFGDLRKNAADADGRLTADQAVTVLRPLFSAREGEPPLPEVYELIADVWGSCAAPPTRGHLGVLDEGVRLFPRRSSLVYRAAELNFRHGYRDAAADLINIGWSGAVDETMRQKFEELRRQLPP